MNRTRWIRALWIRAGARRAAPLLIAVAALAAACAPGADFPDPGNPVTRIPWPDYELLRYDITDQTAARLGSVEMEIERHDDQFRIRLLFVLDEPPVRDEITLDVDAATLRPIRYERHAVDADNVVAVVGVYGVNVEGEPNLTATVTRNGEVEEAEVLVGEFGFDTDSSAWLWRTIPFAQDYQVSYRSVNVVQQRSQLVRLRVVGQDLIRTPAGEFLAWQLEARPGLDRQNVWFTVDAPHILVRWDLEPRRYTLREIVTERPGG